jgi:hypothetical protein
MRLATSALAQSQITTAVIGGVVLHANAGVLPGVTVEVRNVDTNLTRSLVTGQDGRLSALQLPLQAERVSRCSTPSTTRTT